MPRILRPLIVVAILAGLLYLHMYSSIQLPSFITPRSAPPSPGQQQPLGSSLSKNKGPKLVQLEAHIMSKCPDAKDCLLDLIIPAMSKASAHVNLTLSYIGKPTAADDGVECMHGPSECLGNILQLCAAREYPDSDVRWLGFAGCTTGQYERIADRALIEECAAEYGMSFDKLNKCASSEDGQIGIDMLKASVTRSRDAGVKLSCTVRLQDEIRCIRDGAEWKNCKGGTTPEDLVRDIEAAYEKLNV